MKKNALYFGIAALALLVVSCSKGHEIDTLDNQERVTMIDPWTAIDQSPYVIMEKGEGVPIIADLGQTKASMVVNSTYAKVQWSENDSFIMLGWNDYSQVFKVAEYATNTSGERVNFTTLYQTPPAPQHSIFGPSASSIKPGHDSDGDFFGFNIPVIQTAVAGKVKDEYLYSYAQTHFTGSDIDLDDTHHATFKSVLAFVRIRMTGNVVSSVKSITLRGVSSLAGDCVMVPSSDGTPFLTFSRQFVGDVPSPVVTLTGTFAANTDYYFAVAPGAQSSISLVFSDDNGHSITKVASNSVTFSRGAINDIPTIDLGDSFTDTEMATIKWNTATAGAAKPVTIAVIPDGFTAGEMSKYETLANAAMLALFNVEPFKTYKNYFNVYILKVASNESGARISDGTLEEQNRDCYFESTWGKTDYDNMAANEAIISSFVSTKCPDITGGLHTINEVPILVIINDARYGGRCHTSSTGFSYCLAPYTYEGGGISWSYPANEAVSDSNPNQGYHPTPVARFTEVGSNSGNWLNTMVHEFGGHCFSRLADEYWEGTIDKGAASYIDTHRWDNPPYYGVAYGLNVSATYANPGYDDPGKGDPYIKEGWQHLLDKAATLSNTDIRKARIGRFQGGGVSILNRWRSERISCMIDNRFYFSTFQRELIVKRIMTLAGESFNFDSFWNNDVAVDPVRDVVSSPVMGLTDPVPPRPMPLLPPPVFHTDW